MEQKTRQQQQQQKNFGLTKYNSEQIEKFSSFYRMNNEPENGSLCSNVYGNDHVMKERYDQWIVESKKKNEQ